MNALRSGRAGFHRPLHRASVGDHEYRAAAHGGHRYYNGGLRDFTTHYRLGIRDKRDARVHFGAQILIWVKDFHLYLHRRFLSIRFGRDLVDRSVVLAVRECVGSDDALLFGTELREIILIHIDFDLQIVKVGDRDYVAFRAFIAYESGGDKLALFDVALQNRAGDGSADDG